MPSSPHRVQTIDQNLTNLSQPPKTNIEELKSKLTGRNPEILQATAMVPEHRKGGVPLFTEDGLVMPKKLPNPVKENLERQNLHRELMFNQKIGKDVLHQKSELQKALEKHKDQLTKKELGNQQAAQAPELEKVIADRAKRLQSSSQENMDDTDRVINKEFLEARMKLKKSS